MKKLLFALILSVFNLMFYFSMRSIWSGITNMFKISWLQYLIFVLIFTVAVFCIILTILKVKSIVNFILLIISGIFSLALFYMFYLGIGSTKYIIRTFEYSLLYLLIISLVIYIIFYFPKTKLSKNLPFKLSLFILITFTLLVINFDLRINYISNNPVVYAVNENYQIVWTTSADSTASVMVGDKTYYDLYAGSQRSETKVHKVEVPMVELDNIKSYTISSTTIIYRGPYSGLKGRTINRTFDYKPVDLNDGLNYYSLSDTHEYSKAASKTGSYFGDDLDFLVLIGDISSHLELAEDIEVINEIAYNITKGQKPVVYARGNHEVKSNYADRLYQYVGSINQKFYYTFKLSGIFGIVLDLGEDHEDDWWEFYSTAHFDEYRKEQTEFLNQVLLDQDFNDHDVKYRMAISHIPVNYVKDNFLSDIKNNWTILLNQMNLDIMVSGHHHQLMPITTDIPSLTNLTFDQKYSSNPNANSYRTESNFNTFIVSRKSNVQSISIKENEFGRKLTGLATTVDFNLNQQYLKYTNTNNEIVNVINPFTGIEYEQFTFNIGD